MFTLKTRLRPKSDDVAAKIFDGEAIIMNLSTGLYFSMDKVGTAIWELIEAGHDGEGIIATLGTRYDVSADTARGDVERLAAQLLDEGLVVVSEEAPVVTETNGETGTLPYAAPTLHRYDDMAELLALDPPMPGLGDGPWPDGQDAP